MTANLNASRLASWGFLAESQAQGQTSYKVTAMLEKNCCEFCRNMNGKTFQVDSAVGQIKEAVNAENPDDLKTIMPWPKVTKDSMAEFSQMSPEDLAEAGYQVPPFHASCPLRL
jgi:hypothetical protein